MAGNSNPQARSRVIRSGEGSAENWLPPNVGEGSEAAEITETETPEAPQMPTAAELEAMVAEAREEGLEEGHREGFAFGHSEGLESGRQEMLERVQQFDQILQGLSEPFESLDEQVEQEVVTLVIAMVRQLIRREIKADPAQIVGVVREALGILPVSARRIRVLLHPDDAVLVREAYVLGESDQKWQIIEDPVVQRGGCRVYTENSQVDATLESRLNALIAPLLGHEREHSLAADDAAE